MNNLSKFIFVLIALFGYFKTFILSSLFFGFKDRKTSASKFLLFIFNVFVYVFYGFSGMFFGLVYTLFTLCAVYFYLTNKKVGDLYDTFPAFESVRSNFTKNVDQFTDEIFTKKMKMKKEDKDKLINKYLVEYPQHASDIFDKYVEYLVSLLSSLSIKEKTKENPYFKSFYEYLDQLSSNLDFIMLLTSANDIPKSNNTGFKRLDNDSDSDEEPILDDDLVTDPNEDPDLLLLQKMMDGNSGFPDMKQLAKIAQERRDKMTEEEKKQEFEMCQMMMKNFMPNIGTNINMH